MEHDRESIDLNIDVLVIHDKLGDVHTRILHSLKILVAVELFLVLNLIPLQSVSSSSTSSNSHFLIYLYFHSFIWFTFRLSCLSSFIKPPTVLNNKIPRALENVIILLPSIFLGFLMITVVVIIPSSVGYFPIPFLSAVVPSCLSPTGNSRI